MATGAICLRPSADVSLGHHVSPSTLSAGYLAINEAVTDEDSTTIYISYTDETATSVFKMASDVEYKQILSVSSAQFVINACYKLVDVRSPPELYTESTVTINGTQVSLGSIDYAESSGSSADKSGYYDDVLESAEMLELIQSYVNANGVLPDIELSLVSVSTGGEKNGTTMSVSQVYIELTCEYVAGFNVHHKVNGEWAVASAAYKKANGSWSEITEDECKTLLQGSLCAQG